MSIHRLRWALLCVAATSGALLAHGAEASHTVTVKPGDSIDSLARRFGVSTRDIARANGISTDGILRDGKRLTIPDPPPRVARPATMHVAASVVGDRVTVRRGPYEGYRSVTLVDHGTDLVLTRRAGDWFQVRLADGATGWIRQDFVRSGAPAVAHAGPPAQTASARPAQARAAHSSAKRTASAAHKSSKPAPARRSAARPSTSTQSTKARASSHRVASKPTPKRAARSSKVATKPAGKVATRASKRDSALARRRTKPTGSGDVVRTAYAYRGAPYRYGGSSRGGFDCSGFTSYVYASKGVRLPHSAAAQFGHGNKVNKSSLKPGDLVFFETTRRGISHVGIYAGNGKFVHASSARGRVRVDSLNSGYYSARFRGARRVRK